jgi:hypothetical protein
VLPDEPHKAADRLSRDDLCKSESRQHVAPGCELHSQR